LTMLPSRGVIKVPSITADRISHLDSGPFFVADALVSVMFTPVASGSSQLAAFVDSAEARSLRARILRETELDTRQSKLYFDRDGGTTIPLDMSCN
jgi:hypothetical protein